MAPRDRSPFRLRSSIPGLAWPAVPSAAAARQLALLQQLEESQWWPAEALRAQQDRQLSMLLGHAAASVPFYRERLAGIGLRPGRALRPEVWSRIPLLRREDIQQAGAALHSQAVPAGHGRTQKIVTSGSTGKPVTVLKTAMELLYWQCFTIRDHVWHGRDLTKKLAAIRSVARDAAKYPKGLRGRSWGASTARVFANGPGVLLDVETSIEHQVLWLKRENPDYLLTLPTNLLHLAGHCLREAVELPNLRDVGTLGGVLQPEVRELCRRAWGVPVIDLYSAQEVGYVALQCPEAEHYHLQAESSLVEILDARGRPCQPGEWGRVVVTPLHNFAMPLIRYDIGDNAEVGEACACGRGLPVLKRILGRARNMLTLPSGQQTSPGFVNDWFEGFPVNQFQIVQRALDRLEVKIVPRRPFTDAEEKQARESMLDRIGHPFQISFTYHEEIPRGPGGKYEDFKSELEPPESEGPAYTNDP